LVEQDVLPPAQHCRTAGAVGSVRVSLQASPEQHSLLLVHVEPVSLHMPPAGSGRQKNVWQVSPSQHSEESMQKEPSRLQLHAPPPQLMSPQQSSEFSHEPPSPMQQRGTSGAGRHTDPAQHSWPGRSPPRRQVRLGPRHMLHIPN